MKKVLVSLVISVFLFSCGSYKSMPSPDTISKTIKIKSGHNSSYVKANEWIVRTFNDAESVIQFTDKEAGIIKGKYIMAKGQIGTKYVPASEPYYAMITLRVKEGAARIEIAPTTGFKVMNYLGTKLGFSPEQFVASANALVTDFEIHMNKKAQNDNW